MNAGHRPAAPHPFRSLHERSCSSERRRPPGQRCRCGAALPDSDHPGGRGDFRHLAVDSVDMRGWKNGSRRRAADWHKSRPFLSANDRSRWATAPGAGRTRHLRHRRRDPGAWLGHDRHGQARGSRRPAALYSSKPPLFATVLAGPYWLIDHQADGRDAGRTSLPDRPRVWSFCSTVLPAGGLFSSCGSTLADRLGTTDWGRIFMVACRHGRHVSDDVCRFDQQSLAGRGDGARDALFGDTHHGRSRAAVVVLRAGWFFAAFTVTNGLPACRCLP